MLSVLLWPLRSVSGFPAGLYVSCRALGPAGEVVCTDFLFYARGEVLS